MNKSSTAFFCLSNISYLSSVPFAPRHTPFAVGDDVLPLSGGSKRGIPPLSNTGVSSQNSMSSTAVDNAKAAFRGRVSSENATIIDTLSLVFPLLSVVPDWVSCDVSLAPGQTAASAMKLSDEEQHQRASAWWVASRGDYVPMPSPSELVEQWVNRLWRLEVSQPRKISDLDTQTDEIAAAFGMHLGGFGLQLSPRSRGRNGFKYSADLVPLEWNFFRDGFPPSLGHVAWGGITNKLGEVLAQLHLTGQGCAEVSMCSGWSQLHALAFSWRSHITRVDVAYDDFDGDLGDYAAWMQRYNNGDFALRQQPSYKLIEGTTGSTLYVGSRDSGKLARMYSKGVQLGDVDSPWQRIELELHNKQRVIPLDIMIDSDKYFRGAYPAFELIELKAEPCKISTVVKNTAACTLKSLISHAKRSYGRLFDVMGRIGYTSSEIIDAVKVAGVPSRLATVSFIGALDCSD